MSTNSGSRIACVTVGLPATGKTLISQKVCRYLLWLGITTKIFNVGNYRRKLHGAHQLHGFFDPSNPEGERSRREAAVEALNDMIYWFEKEHGVVALYDATNSTRSRRNMLLSECKKHDIQVMFIESICEDEALVLHNIMSVKLSSPDYKDMDPEQAVEDFKARIVHYREAYETVTEENLTYIKLINVGSQVIINHIQGYLQSRIVYYLMNLHIAPRSIFFSRHGESLYNVMGKLGGDSDLSARGKQYAKSLPLLIATHLGNSEQLTVWTSTMKRTIATAEHLTYPKLAWKALDELDAGVCDGMTYEEIEEQFPEDFANRDEDKFNYRYRGGESYRDVVLRLEPVIMELERQRNILIIGHQAILRCIYAYFMNHSHEKLPYIKIPLHTVIQLTPRAYACEEKRFKVDIEAVDTHRPKPKAGAPKTATGTPVESNASDTTKQPIEDGDKDINATITTTTMSTTTFKDSAFQRHKSIHKSQKTPSANVVDPDLEKAKALQSALVEATISESSANPSIALPLDEITTPGVQEPKNTPNNNPLEIVSTPPMTPSQNTETSSATGFSSASALKAEDEVASAHSEEPNLSIKTKDLLTTPPMMRLRVDPHAAWQEGTEYERTAGASPRDPIISPGGRLLPKKKENYHFPLAYIQGSHIMKLSVICIISLGLSLAVLGDAAKHDSPDVAKHHANQHSHENHDKKHHAHENHSDKKHVDKHHAAKTKHQNQKQQQHHHHKANNNHHMAPKVIPSVPYVAGHDYKAPEQSHEAPPAPQQQVELPANNNNNVPEVPPQTHWSAPQRNGKMVVAYWTDWTTSTMPPEAIPFDKITHLNYAFSIVTPDFRPVFETDYLLYRVVREAHARNVKVLMSIGGWTGSQYFSPLAASESGRRTFVDGAVRMVRDFGLDGIDIDWEYPGRLGSACNIFDEANDARNFLILLKELRAALTALPNGNNLEISLATRIVPFDGPNGQLQDVSEFSKVVNHINIMAYDINGSWGTVTGANAPLLGPTEYNYAGGAQAWIDAGFPAQQINMGVPFYGRSLITTTDMTHAQSMAAPFHKRVPIGDNNDGFWTDPCEKTSAYSGVWKYKNLREQGLIDANGNAMGPWIRKFDQESQTPWLYNPETRQFISYDDRESLRLKVDFAKRKDLGGVMLWALNQDSSNFELLDVLQGVRQ